MFKKQKTPYEWGLQCIDSFSVKNCYQYEIALCASLLLHNPLEGGEKKNAGV